MSKKRAPERLRDPGWLYVQRMEKRRSLKDIAEELDTPIGTVFNWCRRHGYSGTRGRYVTGQVARDAPDVTTAINHRKDVDRRNDSTPSLPFLLARFNGVVDANRENDATCLRAALIDLAALAERWATQIPPPHPTDSFSTQPQERAT